ncbi:MAG: 30S ribosomal protein S6 [Acidobacteriota bacterium]|nr:30S ribosomal protein S6 [Acidobacteriota bacterium]
MANYELVFLVNPRLSDEEVVGITDEYKEMITGSGASVVKEESWGKRRLAQPIRKVTDAYYVLLNVECEEGVNPFPELERRLEQSDQIMRYLTVRLDSGRLRHRERMPQAAAETAQEATS